MPTTVPFKNYAPRPSPLSHRLFLSGFQSIAPRYRSAQRELLNWLVDAHLRSGGTDKTQMEQLWERYSASSDQIVTRGHELGDFTHRRWNEMALFGPKGSDLDQKTRFFQQRVNAIFERYYPVDAPAPRGLVHVTCTGYTAPSGAQHLVSQRGWGRQTEVIHAYHMGCYAAHPAIRIASTLSSSVDIVHTELCSLHLDLARHDPAQIVIQSLFADGFMKYQLRSSESTDEALPGLEILASRDEILPNSAEAMAWSTGPFHFTMTLSKEVPVLFASALPRFVVGLLEEAGIAFEMEKSTMAFAVHPGGPRIIELAQKILKLEDSQVRWSRQILSEHGNMSSATLPHIWQRILNDPAVLNGTIIVSLGAGPGLTLSGMVFRLHR